MDFIPLTKPSHGEHEEQEALKAIRSGKLEGDGPYTKLIHKFFEDRYKVEKALFTTSCTDALELSALLLDIQPGDEVILPSYTFVSTAHAFALRGAKIVFADSQSEHPNLDLSEVKRLLTKKTKVVVPVHYAGVACDMDELMGMAKDHGFFVVEDAAQAIESKYKGRYVGTHGHLATFSFHQTKNICCGEGGLLLVNDKRFAHRAEILREKGTNRSAFFRGEVDKYTCVDIGSSFLGSDLNASVLWAQLQRLDEIQSKRIANWNYYASSLKILSEKVKLPTVPAEREHNAHCFYLICSSLEERTELIAHLKSRSIAAPFHYVSLHRSPFYSKMHDGSTLKNCDRYTDCLVRLPLYSDLTEEQRERVISALLDFYK